jgi:hypothetical protein
MRWPWIREARQIEPRLVINPKVLELQTAKEILAEVFHARPGEVEEIIQRRLEKRSRDEQEKSLSYYCCANCKEEQDR